MATTAEWALSFDSGGARCDATHLVAGSATLETPAGRPCVVMAHGFGCTRDSGLDRFAGRFAAAGCDVLLFDYRGFGPSAGEPRQLVSHRRQRADYRAAVRCARALDGIDADRIVVWGTSYSGGHVVAVAAHDPRIAAVISQGGALDGLAILRKPERSDPTASRTKGPRMVAAALLDVGRGLCRRPPHTVAAVGAPGDFAMLTDATSYADYLDMMGPTWRNEICARSLLTVPLNRPIRLASRVACPTLLIIAERDTVAPAAVVRDAASRIGTQAEVIAFDCPHFDIYRGDVFERSVDAQVEFLARTLAPADPR